MKRYFCAAFLLLLTTFLFPQFQYISFDAAMQLSKFKQEVVQTEHVLGLDGVAVLDLLRQIYEARHPGNIQAEQKIPKVFHWIWLGSSVPEVFKLLMQTWKVRHLDWEFKLWTDANADQVTLVNQRFYDATTNYGVKSDILKWELIYQFGGVYVDMDFECLQPIDEFLRYDFFTGLQPLDTQFVQLGAALFGAVPGHPILKHCIDTIKDDWHLNGAPSKSGPVHFTKSIFKAISATGLCDIVIPAFYFYPLGCVDKKVDRESWIQQGAYAIHHWAKSWMPKKFRRKAFKNLGNEDSTDSWND